MNIMNHNRFYILCMLIPTLQCCANICQFILDTPAGNKTFTINGLSGKITGIVTMSGKQLSGKINHYWDYLSFITSEFTNDIPLEFSIYNSKESPGGYIYGKINDNKYGDNGWMPNLFKYPNIDIQLSDISIATKNYYTMYLGEPGSAQLKKYNYQNNWDKFANKRLKSVTKIKNDGDFTSYKFISVCNQSKPILCDSISTETIYSELYKNYELSCTAAGAPYLKVRWTHTTSVQTQLKHEETYDNSKAVHKITSKLKLSQLSFKNLGSYTCKIYNANFKTNINKVFVFTYSLTRTIQDNPLTDVYTANHGDEFNWTINGWPLEQVQLECHDSDAVNIRKSSISYAYSTPQINLIVKIKNETFLNLITCTVKDNGTILGNFNFTRVGATCKAGELGVGKSCKLCPPGETSTTGSAFCFVATNKCKSGEYGVGNECHSCPFGKISPTGTVKIQECKPADSNCTDGNFGYNGTCTKCPIGQISKPKAAKLLDCTIVNGTCEAGWYGINNSCSLCPNGSVSDASTVKVQDCEFKNSDCIVGLYGIGSNCSLCPTGMTSNPNAVKILECWDVKSICKPGSYGTTASCPSCPIGKTSNMSAVKIQECYKVNSSCSEGFWGVSNNCQRCPDTKTSNKGAVKVQECYPVQIKVCNPGYYLSDNKCQKCPDGSTSSDKATDIPDCYPTEADHQPMIKIVVGSSVGVIAIIAVTLVGLFIMRNKSRYHRKKHFPDVICNNINSSASLDSDKFGKIDTRQGHINKNYVKDQGVDLTYSQLSRETSQKHKMEDPLYHDDSTYTHLNKDHHSKRKTSPIMDESLYAHLHDDPFKGIQSSNTDDSVYDCLNKNSTKEVVQNGEEYAQLNRNSPKEEKCKTMKMTCDDEALYTQVNKSPKPKYLEQCEDTLYADQRQLIEEKSVYTDTVIDTGDTYACVELGSASLKRSENRQTLSKHADTVYSTVTEIGHSTYSDAEVFRPPQSNLLNDVYEL